MSIMLLFDWLLFWFLEFRHSLRQTINDRLAKRRPLLFFFVAVGGWTMPNASRSLGAKRRTQI
jgi:hypothetical protein